MTDLVDHDWPNDDLPGILSVVQSATDPKKYTIELSRQIVPGHWTTIVANVEDKNGQHHGIRANPLDRVDIGFLPGDANADRVVNQMDLARIDAVISGQYPADPNLHDLNRDGLMNTDDKVRMGQLLQGINTTRAWNGYEMPDQPD